MLQVIAKFTALIYYVFVWNSVDISCGNILACGTSRYKYQLVNNLQEDYCSSFSLKKEFVF